MWGDAAGYYVYLPSLFIYGFDASKLPDGIVEKTGYGFTIEENGKIFTRYSCGVAILQAPVFFVIHSVAGITDMNQDGFSGIYHLISSFSAIIYSFLGLLLLWHFLRRYFGKTIVFLTMTTIFFGTNLLYYTIDATGLSHIYSFFLFSALLVFLQNFFNEPDERKKTGLFILVSLISAMIILIRPTNIAFVMLAFMFDISSVADFKLKFSQIIKSRRILTLFMAFFIIFLPQFLYWKYCSGNYIIDPYQEYGFTNLCSPKIIKFLFSTNNGLFTYNPLYFVILFALILMILKKQKNGYYILGLFIFFIYLFSSWFVFSFGCGFASRNFVEYTTVFALPMGYFYNDFLKKDILKWCISLPLVLVLVFVNAKLTYSYNKCFIDGDWNWKEYEFLMKSRKYNKVFSYKPNILLDSKKEYSSPETIGIDHISLVNFRRAIVEVDTKIFDKDTDAELVFQISTPDTLLYWNGTQIADQFDENDLGNFRKIKGDFWLPRHYTTKANISTFIWNKGRDSLLVSRFKVHLE